MSCGCKNKNGTMAKQKPVMVKQADGSIELREQTPPPYTREYLIEIKDHLNTRNKTEYGRQRIIEFNEKYFGELIPGYCDQACITRTNNRLDKAFKIVDEWEQTKK